MKVWDAGNVAAVLRKVLDLLAKLVQCCQPKQVHLGQRAFLESIQHMVEGQGKGHVRDKALFNDATKELARDLQLLLWKLREELVIFKQVPQHVHKHVPLFLVGRIFELLENIQQPVNTHATMVNGLKESTGFLVHITRERLLVRI